VKEVEDYKRFGVVVTDKDGNMTRIVEKPSEPISKRANIGLYYIRNWQLLVEAIEWVMQQPTNKGEYFLTDAFQYMIDKGAKIQVVDVEGWHDAGKIDTLLASNRTMLEQRKMARRPANLPSDVKVVDPVYIEDGVTIKRSTVGPNVSIGAGAVIEDSTIRDTIIGEKTRITRSDLRDSLIGNEVVLEGFAGDATVGDHSELRGTKRS
jgi:glucose-1-phosphate thymidylyltransferase